MDLDDEPPAKTVPAPASAPSPATTSGSNGARNIPVEPSRPDWRAGDASAVRTDLGAGPHAPTVGPSEDSDDFRASFADITNVAPFAPAGTGLDSLNDLKTGLPFETQASTRVPLPRKPVVKELPFPPVPQAPAPPTPIDSSARPPKVVLDAYLQAFEVYMRQWDGFNDNVVAHFVARAEERMKKGYNMLRTIGDGDIQDYTTSVAQDVIVRQKWTAACVEHEWRMREFMAFREKML
jgi:hypothetical protein